MLGLGQGARYEDGPVIPMTGDGGRAANLDVLCWPSC